MDLSQKTPEELQRLVGERLRAARVARGMTQEELAALIGISVISVSRIEAGKGSTLETFIRVLKALGLVQTIDSLLPEPSVSPMALLASQGRRASRSRVRKPRSTERS